MRTVGALSRAATTRLRLLSGRNLVGAPEADVLQRTPDALAIPLEDLPRPGVIERVCEAVHIAPSSTRAYLTNAAGGDAVPDWAGGDPGGLRFGVDLSRVRDVHHAPGFGAVIDDEGRAFESSVAEARFYSSDLADLPGAARGRRGPIFKPPAGAPRLPAASVFLPWGGLTNYGHFLLDGLAGLVLLADRGLLRSHPAVAPPLTGWQRELLALTLGPEEAVRELSAPLVRVEDLLFTSCMDHFLHGPNQPLHRVRARILAATAGLPEEFGPGYRVYLTRRGQTKRVMVNESELQAALVQRGFMIVKPESLSVYEQIVLFRSASVIVSATGAALANALFLPAGSQVFEIQPSNFMGIWVRALCQMVDARWRGYFQSSPLEELRVLVNGVHQPGLSFSWRLDLRPFLDFLDARL